MEKNLPDAVRLDEAHAAAASPLLTFRPIASGVRDTMAALAFHAAIARVASLTGPRRRDASRSSSSSAAATTTTCRAGRDDDDYRDGYRDETIQIPAAERRRSDDERRYYDGGRRSSRVNDYYDRRARPTGDSRPAMEPPRRRVGPEDEPGPRRRRLSRDDGFRAREAAM